MSTAKSSFAAKGSAELGQVEHFGQKASGLAGLLESWTPPFVAFPIGTARRIGTDEDLQADVTRSLKALGPCTDGVIVRSSALEEDLEQRGALDSSWCPAEAEKVIEKMKLITDNAPSQFAEKLGFIVQVWIGQEATGHLSNERRVSDEARKWCWEIERGLPAPADPSWFRTDSTTSDEPSLTCESLEALLPALRAVARVMKDSNRRFHMEWVWDGQRVWIVQRDLDRTVEGVAPGSHWNRAPAPELRSLRILKRAADGDFGFPKAEHVRAFAQAGLDHGDVRILCGSVVMRRLSEGKVSRELERDFEDLIEEPVVVRTDLRRSGKDPEILSRRTDTCTERAQLIEFLTDTAAALVKKGTHPNDFAFLIHRFLLAEAGAIAFARPDTSTVLIDATWGLPDSLMYHPHDSYEVDNDSTRIKRYLRCKTDYIDVDGEGDWRSQPAGAPWDWKPALSDETARKIASQAQRVARQVGHSAEVMFFVSRSENGVAVLPWFYCEPQRSAEDVEEARGYYVGERVEITDKSDLDALKIRLDAEDRAQLSIRLRPTFRLMRDRDFIRAVAKTAAKFNVPIELEGSQLSHSYYLLQGTDATVRCKNPWKRPERRQSFGKLVRDMVPVAIKRHGEEATVHSVSREDLELLLRAKVIEEAVEYYWSADTSSSLEELADLLELLRAAATVLDVKFSEIEKASRAKRKERGGFEKGVVLVETREAPDSTRLGIEESEDEASLLDEPPAKRPRPRRVYRLPERRLVLPIAPPSGWKLEQPKAIALEGDEEAVVTYGVTTIRVQIRHRRPEPGKNQLALSDLLDPGET